MALTGSLTHTLRHQTLTTFISSTHTRRSRHPPNLSTHTFLRISRECLQFPKPSKADRPSLPSRLGSRPDFRLWSAPLSFGFFPSDVGLSAWRLAGATFIYQVSQILAWEVMPLLLRRYYNSFGKQLPYETSIWVALEVPMRCLIAFVTFSQIGMIAAPTARGFLEQAWRGATIAGGVAIAFAVRDVFFWDVLSGLYMRFSKPFSVGDTIKDGSSEGLVVKMGLVFTSLLTAENSLLLVPNSRFSSQVIVNKQGCQDW